MPFKGVEIAGAGVSGVHHTSCNVFGGVKDNSKGEIQQGSVKKLRVCKEKFLFFVSVFSKQKKKKEINMGKREEFTAGVGSSSSSAVSPSEQFPERQAQKS